ncbi:stage II sporulation protein D [Halalkalibacter nanhaiisediminis]|uniref:Stage II sporulation protein D n=1 Tax=Halalkalibacter nanhaiisediminis TaxID=688079 RepID=A0A562QSR4_9BACI|nr:stage II sporulation protein D [Halalkalibacter nanhaiisediminis]TWI59799.1 stage II sporulation protein D [Halalkalibacter nanhaiisediminis]
MKRLIMAVILLCTIVLIVPTVLVHVVSGPSEDIVPMQATTPHVEEKQVNKPYNPEKDVTVSVFRSKTEQIEHVPLERYVIGVVASEMPAEFEMEALKAQSLTARTYIIKQMLHPGDIQLPDDAMVTDSVMHQVYHNEDELKALWGADYERKMARIEEAVLSTQGKVLTFEGEPITASFFSTSNGYTENSEDYWQNEIPYLRSVASPWDQSSPRFTSEKAVPITEFEQKLGVTVADNSSVGTIAKRTDGGRVAKVNINGKELSGREVRDKLELDSSDFQWQRQGDQVMIQTRGWGHGVGMSQYGADGMAKEGKNYQEIVRHYYRGIDIQALDPYVAELTARNE